MRDTLAKADLVAVDFEMTGILASPLLRNSILDPVWPLHLQLDASPLLEVQRERAPFHAPPTRPLRVPH
jgi:hypothetical protein